MREIIREITNNPVLMFIVIVFCVMFIAFFIHFILALWPKRNRKKKIDPADKDIREQISWWNPFEHSKFK